MAELVTSFANRFVERLDAAVRSHGCVRVMPTGDSEMSGNNGYMGYRLPFLVGLSEFGWPVRSLGDDVASEASCRFLYDALGGQVAHQSAGGARAIDILDLSGGNIGSLTRKLADALTNYKPDVVPVSLSTNDAGDTNNGVLAHHQRVLKTINAYDSGNCPVPWFVATPPTTLSNNYWAPDSNRRAGADLVRQAFENEANNGILVYPEQELGKVTWYPDADGTTDNNCANGVFYDTAHFKIEGYAIIAAGGLAKCLGVSQKEALRRLAQCQPFGPIDWKYGANVNAAATAEMVTGGPRKRVLTMLSVKNNDAALTATVTLKRNRTAQDGSGSALTTEFAFEVAPGKTAAWTFAFSGGLAEGATGPVAWYNEGWHIAVATAQCNVRACGKSVLA